MKKHNTLHSSSFGQDKHNVSVVKARQEICVCVLTGEGGTGRGG